MIVLLCIGWYVMGVISLIIYCKKYQGYLTVMDLWLSCLMGIAGLVNSVILLLWLFFRWIEHCGIEWDKRIW
jgi:hypothetical protein